MKDPATLPGLERYMLRKARGDAKLLTQAVQVVAAIATDKAEVLLSHLLADTALELSVRRAVLKALAGRATEHSRRLLQEFVAHAGSDPLLMEGRELLERAAK